MTKFIIKPLLAGILLSVSFSCTSIENEELSTEKTLEEIFNDRGNIPLLEDPDPVIENPDHEAIFEEHFSFRVLDEVSVDGELSAYVREVLKEIALQIQDVDPGIKGKFKNITLNDLVKILDPRQPLDPQLEELLERLLKTEKLDLSRLEMPELDGFEQLKKKHEEGYNFEGDNPVVLASNPGDGSCAQEVYIEYGSGARSCGLTLMLDLQAIEDNYLRRSFEAEERFENRNQQILDSGLEEIPVAVEKIRKVLTLIKETRTDEEIQEIRYNLGYLAAVYAYHLRINFPLWHEYGLALNEWYFYKELELFAEIRTIKDAEADVRYDDCIDWVNGVIIKEVNKRCPGDEPVLY